MTIDQLIKDVARLGFESEIEDQDHFIASANRALSIIYMDRPVSKTALVSLSGPRVTQAQEFIEHPSGAVITIPFNGISLSFTSVGRGTCIITDSSGSNTVSLSMKGQLTKQFVSGEGTITLMGDYYYVITNFAVFDDKTSNNTPDIPLYSKYREINPSDWCNDFRSFAGPPCDKNGKPIDSIKLMDGRVCAPYELRGDLYFTYYRSPIPMSLDKYLVPIDISIECEPLLPILTASFLWLDDDPAKAQYYMSLYRDLISNIKRYATNKINADYRVNGWA